MRKLYEGRPQQGHGRFSLDVIAENSYRAALQRGVGDAVHQSAYRLPSQDLFVYIDGGKFGRTQTAFGNVVESQHVDFVEVQFFHLF